MPNIAKSEAGHRAKPSKQEQAANDVYVSDRTILRLYREFTAMPPVNLDDTKSLCERIDMFFDRCDETGVRPTMRGLSLALGHSYENKLEGIWKGQKRAVAIAADSVAVLQRAFTMIQTLFDSFSDHGKTNPNAVKLHAERWHGYSTAVTIKHADDGARPLPDAAEVLRNLSELDDLPDA